MPRPHDRVCPHLAAPRFERSPLLSSSYRNRLLRPQPPPPPPPGPQLQDFTTYTEFDPDGCLTVAPTIITAVDLDRNNTAYLYKDFGIDHFNAAWQHELKTTCDYRLLKTAPWTLAGIWAVANTIEDQRAWQLATAEAISLYWRHDGSNILLVLRDWKTTHNDNHNYGNARVIFTSYPILERTSETALEARLYSDAARTVLTDTLAIAITSGDRHRYAFPMVSFDDTTGSQDYCGTSEELWI